MTISVLDRGDIISYQSFVVEVYPNTIGESTVANDRENEYMTQEVTFAVRKYTSVFYPVSWVDDSIVSEEVCLVDSEQHKYK